MKKGCFIKVVVILTILVASALYIIENKFDEFIGKPGKKYLTDLIKIGINEDIDKIRESDEKDSLDKMIKNYIDEIKNSNTITFSSDDGEEFINMIKDAAEDSILTTNELKDISKILEQMKNERLQKN
jgi:hypothetical protein